MNFNVFCFHLILENTWTEKEWIAKTYAYAWNADAYAHIAVLMMDGIIAAIVDTHMDNNL